MPTPDILTELVAFFRQARTQCERAMEQLSDEQFFRQIDPESNSVAIIVKHLAGNMRSRWRDFLHSDGEKPDRNRDSEFLIEPGETREELMQRWHENWQLVLDTLGSLTEEDLGRTVYVRTKPMSVYGAIIRQITHYAHHAGQIVLLAKHLKGKDWQTLSIARGQSDQFNQGMKESGK